MIKFKSKSDESRNTTNVKLSEVFMASALLKCSDETGFVIHSGILHCKLEDNPLSWHKDETVYTCAVFKDARYVYSK